MYHQVKVECQKEIYQVLGVWWKNGNLEDEIMEFRMTVHLFGATSYPSVANFALKMVADRMKKTLVSHWDKFSSNKKEVISAISPEVMSDNIKSLDLTKDTLPME
ncbi:uncharacterized protein LOC119579720 [Penaeus monodon]|uniref:uncharacterized protein LOC119579720 n=1 Tax=Penaeus monodon TaxID=6687 RepID=UPI0018A77F81|nr:uncharacterized protein LOC119579720 [Penaeus monodon]